MSTFSALGATERRAIGPAQRLSRQSLDEVQQRRSLPRALRSNVSPVCPLPSSEATPAACWLPAMAATRSPGPWPRCPPRRRVHPHSARSSSRESTHCAGLRRVGYDPGGLRGKPLWRLPVGLLLSSSGGRSLWAPRLRLCVCSFVAVAGCTTGSPRPFRCPPSLCGTRFWASACSCGEVAYQDCGVWHITQTAYLYRCI